jgi:hypothetical protein
MASGNMTRREIAALAAAVLIPFVAALWKVEPPVSDDALFEYYGRAISHGSRLYVDLWDHHLPGIYLVNAALQQLFATRYVMHALGQAIFDAASVLLFAYILRRNDVRLWVPATLAFSVVISVVPNSLNTVENVALPFQLLAFALWSDGRRVASAVALAIATTFWILGAALLIALLFGGRSTTKERIVMAAAFFGTLVVYAAVLLGWFGAHEVGTLVHSWAPYAASNAAVTSTFRGPLGAVAVLYHGLVGTGIGILLAALAAVVRKPATPAQRFALVWLGCALVAAVAPGSFYAHYFIPAIPPCIFAIAAFGVDRRVTVRRVAFGAVAVFFAFRTVGSMLHTTPLVQAESHDQAAVGERVRAVSGAGTVIRTDDYAPAIYLAADAVGQDAFSLVPSGSHPAEGRPSTNAVLLVHRDSVGGFAVPRGAVDCGHYGKWSLYALSEAGPQARAKCVAQSVNAKAPG